MLQGTVVDICAWMLQSAVGVRAVCLLMSSKNSETHSISPSSVIFTAFMNQQATDASPHFWRHGAQFIPFTCMYTYVKCMKLRAPFVLWRQKTKKVTEGLVKASMWHPEGGLPPFSHGLNTWTFAPEHNTWTFGIRTLKGAYCLHMPNDRQGVAVVVWSPLLSILRQWEATDF